MTSVRELGEAPHVSMRMAGRMHRHSHDGRASENFFTEIRWFLRTNEFVALAVKPVVAAGKHEGARTTIRDHELTTEFGTPTVPMK